MNEAVHREQRFTPDNPCPICGGWQSDRRGQGVRCHGFLSTEGTTAYCSREEYAGTLKINAETDTYAHQLTGNCGCGTQHDRGDPDGAGRHDWDPEEDEPTASPDPRIVATYDYRDENGKLAFQVIRYEPKDFRQRRPLDPDEDVRQLTDDGAKISNGWVWRVKDVRPVPYRLPELLDADPGQPVFIVEGEKDADNVAALGLVATTNAGGAGKWRDDLNEFLRDRHVVLLPDLDAQGERHAEDVVRRLTGVAASVTVVRLPGLPEKGDVSVWIAAGGTAEALNARRLQAQLLPTIVVSGRQLRENTNDALDAIQAANTPPTIFVRGGKLTRVRLDEHAQPIVDTLTESQLRGRMTRVANYFQTGPRNRQVHTPPPLPVVQDILALGRWPLPVLDAVVETPILRPDGSIHDRRGYDPATRLYYVPADDLVMPTIAERPTDQQVANALGLLLDELLPDFPFVDQPSKANLLGLLFTPLLRQALDGQAPLALLDKPGPGTGASLLAEIIAIIATGRPAAMMTAPKDDEEWRKKITALLLNGSTMITIDNVKYPLDAASLAAALTATTWEDRKLGRNEIVRAPQRATWMATGINIHVAGDVGRRSYFSRLDARTARPWQRTGFRHPKLKAWTLEHRGELLAALLTLARAWFAAGCPKTDVPVIGGFEPWAETVGSILVFTGVDGFLGNLEQLYEQIDEEGVEWDAFISCWYEIYGDQLVTVKTLATEIGTETSRLREVLPGRLLEVLEGRGSFTHRLGKALAGRVDRIHGYLRLEQAKPDTHAKVARWRVRDMRDVAGSSNPSRRRKREDSMGEGGPTNPPNTANPAGTEAAAPPPPWATPSFGSPPPCFGQHPKHGGTGPAGVEFHQGVLTGDPPTDPDLKLRVCINQCAQEPACVKQTNGRGLG